MFSSSPGRGEGREISIPSVTSAVAFTHSHSLQSLTCNVKLFLVLAEARASMLSQPSDKTYVSIGGEATSSAYTKPLPNNYTIDESDL